MDSKKIKNNINYTNLLIYLKNHSLTFLFNPFEILYVYTVYYYIDFI